MAWDEVGTRCRRVVVWSYRMRRMGDELIFKLFMTDI